MDKYTGAKTIGDGTYGSVLKAINKTNGMHLFQRCLTSSLRRNRSYQTHEEEILPMGPVYQPEGNLIAHETESSEHCLTIRSQP